MARRKHGLGSVVLVALALVAGLILFGGLFRLMLAAGVAFVIWKVLFDRTPAVSTAPTRLAPLPELPLPVEPDDELRRLDQELEQAIRAANATRTGAVSAHEG